MENNNDKEKKDLEWSEFVMNLTPEYEYPRKDQMQQLELRGKEDHRNHPKYKFGRFENPRNDSNED